MRNDQFFIPHHSSEQIQPREHSIPDNSPRQTHSPEVHSFTFQHIKDVESRIYGYRETALEMKSMKGRWLRSVFRPSNPLADLNKLIEQESRVAGKLFGPHDRLWLDVEGSSVLSNNLSVGDWYHLSESHDARGNVTRRTLLHFETHPTHIQKLYKGYAVDMSTEELETFITAVMLYEEQVRESLYPLDQELFDLTD